LEDITRPEDFSFFGDEARAVMIFKWMRFYCYHPGVSKIVDKPRRDELKNHLNLPFGFGQRLGSFIINKFNTFKKWGLICAVDDGMKYHAATDTWLSQTWDGNVEQTRQSISRDTRAPSSVRILQKRPGPSLTPERDKRQRSATVSDANLLGSSSTLSDNSIVMRAPSLPTEPHRASVTSQVSHAGQGVEKMVLYRSTSERLPQKGVPTVRSAAFMNFIRGVSSPSVSDCSTTSTRPTTNTNLDSSDAIEAEENGQTPRNLSIPRRSPPRNLVPDHRDLSIRLEELAGRHDVAQATASALSGRSQGSLVALKQKERICRRELNESIQELEAARNSHKHLVTEYEILKSELRTSAYILDKICEGSKTVIPPTPAWISEADFIKRLEEIGREDDDTWLESKKAERLELEKKMAAQSEVKARKKEVVMERKGQIKELQANIRDMQMECAKYRRQKAKVEDELSEFMEIDSGSSGTVSPVEYILSDTEDIDETDSVK